MNLTKKLWLAWGAFGIQMIIALAVGQYEIAIACAVIGAAFGWIAVFKD